jgi:hypothetical protein
MCIIHENAHALLYTKDYKLNMIMKKYACTMIMSSMMLSFMKDAPALRFPQYHYDDVMTGTGYVMSSL